jgi:hypothetical protein
VPHSSALHSTTSLKQLAALALLVTLVIPSASAAHSHQHLRVLDRDLKMLIDRGVTQSPTLGKLVAEVEASPLLVFIECALRLPSGVGARTNFVTSVGETRLLRVAIDCSLTNRWQISLVAHELRHVLEVGRHPKVVDVEAMESLYENIGYPTARDGAIRHFETDAAIAVQKAVSEELGAVRATPGAMAY